ncbi:50S ribosomal protein L6 [Abyssibacter profundi]|uniref:Large ribosomal subunit protein uL6 n=1 Tax=Abyssibacter profundi TaxID=2182787 RepID=A0A363UIU9_9GAMM|nr:50S ribosomal protein L6 [Abyssibacter profundi]MBV59730.1 50S ribosomal protein L6 [Nevskiales bacterium]PWN55348.1 50S ribosomal protein L6 [Abyssibacter profundi]
MSRVAKNPITLPAGVEVKFADGRVMVKGKNGQLDMDVPAGIELSVEDGLVRVSDESIAQNTSMSGTMRALVNNMVVGVSTGFERRLQLVGVGYRAQAQGNKLNLALGFSHPIDYPVPEGITIETPSQTEIVVKGANKQVVGQVAAEIRAFRPPEPYKGKGVRYSDERVLRKEAKKK